MTDQTEESTGVTQQISNAAYELAVWLFPVYIFWGIMVMVAMSLPDRSARVIGVVLACVLSVFHALARMRKLARLEADHA